MLLRYIMWLFNGTLMTVFCCCRHDVVIVSVYPDHLMNVEHRQVAADSQMKQRDLVMNLPVDQSFCSTATV